MPTPPSKPESPPDPDQWLDEFGDHLHGYAFYRTNNHHAVEDLVQETLMAAWRGWEKFEGRSTVKTWLSSQNRIQCPPK
ncbi:MAG: DNA-directed RNA polymerase specialized sigma24 family protein [Verrucomicrobiales bacterium]|jgi:DNA-directed RNA polymerase specialized sigma24 family protein